MTTLVRIQRKGQMTLPNRFRVAAGVSEGDLVELSIHKGKIVMSPQVVIDRSKLLSADDEYTPAQRRVIDARLAKAMAEVKKGQVSPAFETIAEFAASLKSDAKKLRVKTKRSSTR